MAKKPVDPLKAKEKKQKIIAAGGGVLLLALLGFQGPKMLKRLNQKPLPPPVATTVNNGVPPTLAAPSLGGTGSTTSTPGSLSGSGDAPVAPVANLASFSRFSSKDPFLHQLEGAGGSSTGSSGSGSSTPSGSTGGSGSTSAGSGTGGVKPSPGTAVISVNGALATVAVGSDFPQASSSDAAVFHLVSVTAHTAKVSIAGGSYTSGAATVTLRENKPVTLMNTADGTRYTLVLEPQGTSVSSSGSSTTTSSTTTTSQSPPTTTAP